MKYLAVLSLLFTFSAVSFAESERTWQPGAVGTIDTRNCDNARMGGRESEGQLNCAGQLHGLTPQNYRKSDTTTVFPSWEAAYPNCQSGDMILGSYQWTRGGWKFAGYVCGGMAPRMIGENNNNNN